jgi:two-component system, chemotaxis family, protein-glutamate methylesterase/glutaminase
MTRPIPVNLPPGRTPDQPLDRPLDRPFDRPFHRPFDRPLSRWLDRPLGAIVIGASAGGVEALGVLLPALPARLAAPVLIVLHLPRERPSRLAEIFALRCALPVREAQDKEPVLPGTVYFAPPDYHLLLEAGPQLALSADEPVHFSRPSIDVLFESAADLYRERLLGLVLTGASRDGTAGLNAVYRAGGITVVQQPESAKARLMPASALQQSPVDFVLTLERLAGLLASLPVQGAVDGG